MADRQKFYWMFILVRLIALSIGLPVAAEINIRGELAAVVEGFNAQVRQLKIEETASIAAFNDFIRGHLSTHWDTEQMAMHLLGSEIYQDLSMVQQHRIQQSLETTFYRYAYEIMDEYKQTPLLLVDDLVQDEKGRLRIKIRGKPQGLPMLTGELYLSVEVDDWNIIDAGYAGLTYTALKRSTYRRKFNRSGADGLTAWLDRKNQRFFADYCTPELSIVMPFAVQTLCAKLNRAGL